jgi:cell division ATPase FtsA
VKVLVARLTPNAAEVQIIGVGQAETGGHDISGGRLEAAAVTAPVNLALTLAEDSTEAVAGRKIVPDDVIFALAGRACLGRLFSVRQNRPKPADPVTPKEIVALRRKVERLVRQGLTDLPVEGGQWQALAVSDAGLRLDGRLALEGIGLTGKEITLAAFGVAVQSGALRALEVLANRLDLTIANVMAAPHALAAAIPYPEAIILDIGFSGTDVCLIRDNALVSAGSIPFGGAFFTQILALGLTLEWAEAENLKRTFSAGQPVGVEAEQIESLLVNARRRWHEALMEYLRLAAVGEPLPRKICLTGGGSLLPGLDKLLGANPAPFQSAPEVVWVGPSAFTAIKDMTHTLDYRLFALALSLTASISEE